MRELVRTLQLATLLTKGELTLPISKDSRFGLWLTEWRDEHSPNEYTPGWRGEHCKNGVLCVLSFLGGEYPERIYTSYQPGRRECTYHISLEDAASATCADSCHNTCSDCECAANEEEEWGGEEEE